jgi:hypothetical protein
MLFLAAVWMVLGCMQTNHDSYSEDSYADQIIGYWACESGDCPDEEISFTLEEGVPSYNSWLHQRPSASDGSWSLTGKQLKINCCAGLSYQYDIIKLNDATLILRDVSTSGEAKFIRLNSE